MLSRDGPAIDPFASVSVPEGDVEAPVVPLGLATPEVVLVSVGLKRITGPGFEPSSRSDADISSLQERAHINSVATEHANISVFVAAPRTAEMKFERMTTKHLVLR